MRLRIHILIIASLFFSPHCLMAEQFGVVTNELKAAARFKEGVDLWHSGHRNNAVLAWEKAIELDPKLTEAHYNLGVALRDKEILSDQENCLEKDDILQCLSAKSNLSHGPATQLEKALRSLKEASRLNPDHPKAVYMKGVIEGQLERYDTAKTSLIQHLDKHPKDAQGHYLLCAAYRAQREFNNAIASCEQAVVEKPGYLEANHMLGMIYLSLERSEDAVTAFKEVVRLQPGLQSGWFNLGLAYSGQDSFIEAIDAYKRALDIGPANGAINLNLGAAYDELGRGSRAIAFTRTARELFSEKQEWRQVARAEQNLNRFLNKYWGLPDKKPFFLN
ncbi:MAG: tetratricopeptide repeat protein [Candidatus Nitronauta litoralis]|uniref:Tetratricopeptide repeat protein n=1 Tax=Candidatus Nitronauta litoralis TaxID=2705533 RepID=A0A7T0G146_9BACT|nr:MAG: tetratricopeptide repeat protein [Candidatus Nitronauta litoralis]